MTPDDTRTVVAATIRAGRAARGWSQERLAVEVHVKGCSIHPDSLSRIETGGRRLEVGELVAIAAALDVAPAALLEGRLPAVILTSREAT